MVSESSLGMKSIFIIFLLTGLFLVSLYQFGLGVASSYGKPASLIDDPRINMSGIESQLSQASSDADDKFESFAKDNLFVTAGEIVLFSVWGIWKLVGGTIKAMYTILMGGLVNVIGIDPMVVGVVSAILLISLIFAGWRLIKQGE